MLDIRKKTLMPSSCHCSLTRCCCSATWQLTSESGSNTILFSSSCGRWYVCLYRATVTTWRQASSLRSPWALWKSGEVWASRWSTNTSRVEVVTTFPSFWTMETSLPHSCGRKPTMRLSRLPHPTRDHPEVSSAGTAAQREQCKRPTTPADVRRGEVAVLKATGSDASLASLSRCVALSHILQKIWPRFHTLNVLILS